jgi:cation:H+ antiporter
MGPIIISIFWFFVLGISLSILVKSADYFVKFAEILGKNFNIPNFIIGATLVAFGTSLPELAVSILSIFKNEPENISGTVLGSNIGNVFFILGIAMSISSFSIRFTEHRIEYLLLILSSVLAAYFLWDLHFSVVEAIICLLILIIYLVYVLKYSKNNNLKENTNDTIENLDWKKYSLFIASIAGIWISAKFTTDAITAISEQINIGNEIISQTLVALGTSLPELAVTFAAVRSKQFGIVLGNIIGSNIFNILGILSIPTLLGKIGNHEFLLKENNVQYLSIPIMLLSTFLILTASFFNKTPRAMGILFILIYLFYVVASFMGVNISNLIPSF